MDRNEIIETLRTVKHPGLGDKDIVELGMVESVVVDGRDVVITLAFGPHKDPLSNYIQGASRACVIRDFGQDVNVTVKTVIRKEKPRKAPQEMDRSRIEKVRHIIGIASGKGGVGKSTVAVNLAVALSALGYRVGLADADIYGPSVPTMTSTEGQMPEAYEEEGKQWILPIEKYGVKWMSVGYFAREAGQALIWRGPMACSAVKQIILQVDWGELDFLLVDMPPGTGDIHISLVQDIPLEGAVVVTTPQKVALADVEKGVNMFRNPSVGKPIYGLVENMAWFTPEELPQNRYYIFGREGGVEMARGLGLDLLGQVPLVQSIREGGDAGEPVALDPTRPDGAAFRDIAAMLSSKF